MTFRLYYYYVNAFGVYTQKTEWHALAKSLSLSAPLSTSQHLPATLSYSQPLSATQIATAPKELNPPIDPKDPLDPNKGRVFWVKRVDRVKRGWSC